MLTLLFLTAAASIEVWTAAHDGRTQQFTKAFESELSRRSQPKGEVVTRALIQGVEDRRGDRVRTQVDLSSSGRKPKTVRCIVSEAQMNRCVVKAVDAAIRYAEDR